MNAWLGYRITTFVIGIVALFVHHGYLIVPAVLFLASVLPPQIANWGLTGISHKGIFMNKGSASKDVEVCTISITQASANMVAP